MSFLPSNIVIVAAARTPIGSFQGLLSEHSVCSLGSIAIAGVLEKAGIQPERVCEVLMGCVLPAGAGQAPARQAVLKAGIPDKVPATTVNKVCGSGMKTVMLGASQLITTEADLIVAGGMESMTNTPYLLDKARKGLRMGHASLKDHMFLDGLEDACNGQLMGLFGQQMADRFSLSREGMDDYAILSLERAKAAIASGAFSEEIIPVETRRGTVLEDEQPGKGKPEKIRKLKPAFAKEGSVTAANSSSISDGAAALLLMREDDALAIGLQPLARISGYCSVARDPAEFTLAPIDAINKLLKQINWSHQDVDLFEINEAFALVAMLAIQELKLNPSRVNIHGGACALGHPLGASGARIIVTLLHALKRKGLQKGLASLCIGGGEATAIALETM